MSEFIDKRAIMHAYALCAPWVTVVHYEFNHARMIFTNDGGQGSSPNVEDPTMGFTVSTIPINTECGHRERRAH